MRLTKINHYKLRYLAHVEVAQNKEIQLLRKELTVFSMSMLIVVVSPVLAAALSFVAYMVVDNNHKFMASQISAVLFLFAVICFPVNYVGKLMGKRLHRVCRPVNGWQPSYAEDAGGGGGGEGEGQTRHW